MHQRTWLIFCQLVPNICFDRYFSGEGLPKYRLFIFSCFFYYGLFVFFVSSSSYFFFFFKARCKQTNEVLGKQDSFKWGIRTVELAHFIERAVDTGKWNPSWKDVCPAGPRTAGGCQEGELRKQGTRRGGYHGSVCFLPPSLSQVTPSLDWPSFSLTPLPHWRLRVSTNTVRGQKLFSTERKCHLVFLWSYFLNTTSFNCKIKLNRRMLSWLKA